MPKTPPPMSVGMRMVAMMKALVRMRSRYSRFAISQILCIDFAPDYFDKDVFQARLHDLEAGDARLCCGSGKKCLRIGAVAQLDFGMAAVVLRGLNGGMIEEGSVAFEVHDNAVGGVARLDLAHGAGEDETTVVDEADVVAELFDLIHAMGGEEDGAALLAEVDEGVLEERGVDGIEAAEGLVHDDEVGFVKECSDELNLLLHAFGELLRFFVDG